MDELLHECCTVIHRFFTETITAQDYHEVVACLRYILETLGQDVVSKAMPDICKTIGCPTTYSPFDHMERLRFGISFYADEKDLHPATIALKETWNRVRAPI